MTLPCRLERLSSYLDGELSPREMTETEHHLEGCDSCRRELEALRRVVFRLHRLERESPPPSIAAALERRLVSEGKRRRPLEFLQRLGNRPAAESTLLPWFALVITLVALLLLFAQALERRQQGAARLVALGELQEGEPASGGASAELAPGGGTETRSTDPAAPVAGGGPVKSRHVAGRELVYREGIWLELGLALSSEAEPIAVVEGEVDPRLESLSGLDELRRLGGPVRLRIGDRVVELRFQGP